MNLKSLLKILMSAIFFLCVFSCEIDDDTYNLSGQTPKRNYVITNGKSATIISKYDADYDIIIRFAKVMKNNLYSIEKVYLAANSDENLSTHVNTNKYIFCKQTNTDMIGPIMVKRPKSGDSWIGGNHLYLNQESGIKSAITNFYSIYADSILIEKGAAYADVVTIKVENTIFDPDVAPSDGKTILSSPLITENISYSISGGEIVVDVEHHYLKNVHVGKYYGMQSVFNSSQFITAQGGYYDWKKKTATDNTFYIKKTDAPKFNNFSQKAGNNIYYQNNILLPCSLGNHTYIEDDGNVFLYKEKKAYHVLIENKDIAKETILSWKGIYNWKKPIVDDEYNYIYEYCDGKRNYISITAKKSYDSITIPTPEYAINSTFYITENSDNISIDNIITNKLNLSAQGQGYICGFFVPFED